MKSLCFFVCLVLSLSANAESTKSSLAAFDQLKSLVGEWKKEGTDGRDFYISFESTANGTVLVENWMYKGASHSLTLYHQDGEKLLATHYCPQGNQPRLCYDSTKTGQGISFLFQDVTNLSSGASHQYSLSFDILNENTLLRNESYIKEGEIKPSSLKLLRLEKESL